MGKPTGFLDHPRREPGYRPVEERIRDYRDVAKAMTRDEVRVQASRCMDCGIPFCHTLGCPVGNLIPEWNDLVTQGRWDEAYERLALTNPFPEITGRVCPAPCEASCTLSINDAPVTIRHIEQAIVEYGFEKGLVRPPRPAAESGRKVAVVGSGPAGLAAAWRLREAGHGVTVFEKADKPGGLLRFGIPDFKLEKWVVERRIRLMEEAGIVFRISWTPSVAELKGFDAVVLAMGAGTPRPLAVPGADLKGVHYALEFLEGSNRFVAGEKRAEEIISAKGRNVLVLGGGDTGSDCVGTSVRQGAKKVWQYEIMPKPMEWEHDWNPQWPNWPMILRTSSSHEEGVERDWSVLLKALEGRDGRVAAARFVRVEWRRKEGSPRPEMVELGGTEFRLDVDLVLLATGFVHVEHSPFLRELGVELNEAGNIKVGPDYATSVRGVFAAGDAATGASLIVRAINHGQRAASSVSAWLAGGG